MCQKLAFLREENACRDSIGNHEHLRLLCSLHFAVLSAGDLTGIKRLCPPTKLSHSPINDGFGTTIGKQIGGVAA